MSQLMNTTISESINYINNVNSNIEKESNFLFYFKLFSFFIITVITFSFGLLPLYFARMREGLIILNYANPFSGGIFIAIGLFHLLPDASYDFLAYYKSPEGKTSFFYGFPMSYFIAFLSYSLILYLEKVAFSSDELDSKDNEMLIDKAIKEPLLGRKSSNSEKDNLGVNNNLNDKHKVVPTLMSKVNKGK